MVQISLSGSLLQTAINVKLQLYVNRKVNCSTISTKQNISNYTRIRQKAESSKMGIRKLKITLLITNNNINKRPYKIINMKTQIERILVRLAGFI